MFRSRLHLIGGGPGTLGSLRVQLARLLGPAVAPRSRKPTVAYVGAASGDNAEFQAMIGAEIVAAGGRLLPVKLASARAKASAARTALSEADLIFVSGGDVELGMTVLHERGIVPLFEELGRTGPPMVGISAGSIMLARAWVHFPDDPRGAATCFPCLGLAPMYVDAHGSDERWAELKALLRLRDALGEAGAVGYGLTRRGGLTVEPGPRGIALVPFGTAAPRFVARAGRVVRDGVLALGGRETVHFAATPRREPRQR